MGVSEEKAAAYVRVSKDKSQGGRYGEIISPAQQLAAIRKVADEMGWAISHVEEDIDYSGFRIHYTKRPGLMRLLGAAKRHEFQALIVYKIDRIGRTAAEQLEIIKTFEDEGIAVISATERFNTQTAAGRLARNIQAPIAQFYSEQLSENIRGAKLTMVSQKKRVPGGQPPYGYMWENKRLVPDPTTAWVVPKMFEVALSVGKNRTCQRVWDYLTEQGIAAPQSRRAWSPDSIRYILRNPIYIGELQFDGERYKIDIEPIVDRELWSAVQALVAKGKPKSKAKKHLLTGFIFCTWREGHKEEGWDNPEQLTFEHQAGHGDNRRYVCKMANRYPQGRGRCPLPILAADGLEKALLKELVAYLRRHGAKDFSGDEVADDELAETQETLQQLGRQLQEVSGWLNSLFEDYHKYKVITREQFAARNRQYLQEQASLKAEYDRLEYRVGLLKQMREAQEEARVALEDSWNHLDLDERRRVLALLIKRIFVHDDRITVETYDETFDIFPTLIYRNCLYFDGQEPRVNKGMFGKGRRPKKQRK